MEEEEQNYHQQQFDDDDNVSEEEAPPVSCKMAAPIFTQMSDKKDGLKKSAASLFKCSARHVRNFVEKDPFNDLIFMEGLKCVDERGKMGGSLLITRVNNKHVPPQLIYGVPKLEYPYTKKSFRNKRKQPESNISSLISPSGLEFMGSVPSSVKSYYLGNKYVKRGGEEIVYMTTSG